MDYNWLVLIFYRDSLSRIQLDIIYPCFELVSSTPNLLCIQCFNCAFSTKEGSLFSAMLSASIERHHPIVNYFHPRLHDTNLGNGKFNAILA